MNNIIKISIVVTLALVVALFAGCGKKKTEKPKNESSILTGGAIEEIFGKDDEVTSDVGKVELDPNTEEDTVDISVLDKLEGDNSNNTSKNESSKDSSSKNESSSKNQSSSSKNESSSKNQGSGSSSKNESSSKNQGSGSSSKNESSSKNQGSSSKNPSSSQTSSGSLGDDLEKDTDSKTYTPGWI